MPMRYLIDGYNLLYALGLARKNGGQAGWERGRRQLLDWLADRHGKSTNAVTIIFDAQNSLGGVVEETYRGLHVLRDRGRTADDMIEDMLKSERSPETLTVVSNDARVREAARRRRAHVAKCEEYVDALMEPRTESIGDVGDEKGVRDSAADREEFLQAFGGR